MEKPGVEIPFTAATTPFWEAARRHELQLPRCEQCRRVHWYPRHTCPFCGSRDIGWEPASGKAEILTFTVVQQNFATGGVRRDTPYVVAIVTLAEGPRMTTNIVGCLPEHVRIGLPVTVRFEDVGLAAPVAVFAPAS